MQALTVKQTAEFVEWLDELKDKRAQLRIAARLRLAEACNLGNWNAIDGALSEMKVDIGLGYRLYFTRKANVLIVMLAGGDKSSQTRDITRAKRILKELE
jgi:putative addiction module killer protein